MFFKKPEYYTFCLQIAVEEAHLFFLACHVQPA